LFIDKIEIPTEEIVVWKNADYLESKLIAAGERLQLLHNL